MSVRTSVAPLILLAVASWALAQDPAATAKKGGSARWTQGTGTLPNRHGQVWREYDISPYTDRAGDGAKPEQAGVDWILRDTGTQAWFSGPLGLLSANRRTLSVYHTPAMHRVVSQVVDRMVDGPAQSYTFGVQLMTVGSPNWRTKAHRFLRPVTVGTPGVQAWVLSKEDAAVLLDDLRKRTDYRQHNSANLLIHNGQTGKVSIRRPKDYIRDVAAQGWPGHQMEKGQAEEGFSLELSPLLSKDRQTIDAVVQCRVDQLERLVPVAIDVPSATVARQRVEIQVPQMAGWRLKERFRWPRSEVLLISCGVVAIPSAGRPTTLGISNPFATSPARADTLLLVECKGKTSPTPAGKRPEERIGSLNYRDRY